MPTRILLLRHAESADPTVFHGAESDIGLSAWGSQQAEIAATGLAAYHPDAIVSSAMRRAIDTATPIAAACGLELQIEPLLHERRVGSLAGIPTSSHQWRETLQRWMAGDTAFAPEGAESFDAMQDRLLPVWHNLTQRYTDRTLLIVAHGAVCKVLLLSLLPGRSAADWHRLGVVPNVGLSELIGAGDEWEAVQLNVPLAPQRPEVPPG
jgi:broad specificity phosphatase PhoE